MTRFAKSFRQVQDDLRLVGVKIVHDREWQEYVVSYQGSTYHTDDLADAWVTGMMMMTERQTNPPEGRTQGPWHRKAGGVVLEKEMVEQLEDMVDQFSLQDVLSALAAVCYAKQEHIASAWQDAGLAKVWERAAKQIDGLAGRPAITQVS